MTAKEKTAAAMPCEDLIGERAARLRPALLLNLGVPSLKARRFANCSSGPH